MAQGTLGFQYEAETTSSGVTALAGIPVDLDLIKASGLDRAIREHVRVAGKQGWLDLQMIVALIVLNLAGGDGLEDLERLEQDAGLAAVMEAVERQLLSRAERRALPGRWRKQRERTWPSPAAMADWLARFHDPDRDGRRVPGTAVIPPMGDPLRSRTVRMNGTVYCHKALQKTYSELGFRRGRRAPSATAFGSSKAYRPRKLMCLKASGSSKAYRPRKLMCLKASGEILATSVASGGVVEIGCRRGQAGAERSPQ